MASKGFFTFARRLARGERMLLAILLAALCGVVTFQVVCRNLGIYVAWTTDVAILLLTWQVFIAGALAIHAGTHYVVDVFQGPGRRLDLALTALSVVTMAAVLVLFVWQGTVTMKLVARRLSGAGEISMAAYFAAMPVCGALGLVHLVEVTLRKVLDMQPGSAE